MSRGAGDPKNWRELRIRLREMGARCVRTRGSHETWRFDDGASFIVVRNHLANSVPVGVIVGLRRLCARRDLGDDDEPAPLGRTRSWGSRARRVNSKNEVQSWAKETAVVVAARGAGARGPGEAARRAAARRRAGTGRARRGIRRAEDAATLRPRTSEG